MSLLSKFSYKSLSLTIFVLSISGCSMDALTGDMMAAFAVNHVGPYTMGTTDLYMACSNGESTGNMLMAYGRVTDQPHKAGVAAHGAAGMCAELQAFEAELDYTRHLYAKRGTEAADARIRQQRAHTLAATRHYRAYQHLVAAYGTPGGATCPEIPEGEQLLYLVGLSSGVQAFLNDRVGGGQVGVPIAVPGEVLRGTHCMDNEKFWGMPGAMRAAIWSSLPGGSPSGEDHWAILTEARSIGDTEGVRIARAISIQAADGAGREDLVRTFVQGHQASQDNFKPNPKGSLLDSFATVIIQHFSDVRWIQATGHRTPTGQLGHFWDEDEEEASGDMDDLLDGDSDTEE